MESSLWLNAAGAHKKNLLQIKGFLYFCVHPCSGKKDILLTFSEPCYCHVGEGLAGQPLQKAGQFNAHTAAVGPQGSEKKVMKISRLTCSKSSQ